jgi:hypothetical protein
MRPHETRSRPEGWPDRPGTGRIGNSVGGQDRIVERVQYGPLQQVIRRLDDVHGLGIADVVEPVGVVVEAVAGPEEHAVAPVRERDDDAAAEITGSAQGSGRCVEQAGCRADIVEGDTVRRGGDADGGDIMVRAARFVVDEICQREGRRTLAWVEIVRGLLSAFSCLST